MKLYKYTVEQLQEAVGSSTSLRQVLIKLKVKPAGGNYSTLKKAIKYFNLDTSHFTGQASNKGKKFGPVRPISDYLTNRVPIQSHKLRLRLIKEKIFEAKCSRCGKDSWLQNPIPLELDHINGIHEDNRLDNLRLLCPNCHALTPNYRGKNIGLSSGLP